MIYVECYADVALVRALGIPRKRLKHLGGKFNVVDAVRNSEGSTGVLDEDPEDHQPPELKKNYTAEEKGTLRCLRHKQATSKRFVILCPDLEGWLLGRASANGIDASQFGIATDPHELHETQGYEQKPGFPKFLLELLAKDSEMRQLKSWLQQAP